MVRWTSPLHGHPDDDGSRMACELGSSLTRPLLDDLLVDPRRISQVLAGADPGEGDAFARAMRWGGLPQVVQAPEDARSALLAETRQAWLDATLPALARGADASTAARLRKAAARQAATVLSYARLARDSTTSPSTARRYLAYLVDSQQIFLLAPFKRNLTSDAVRTPKLYWLDSGLLRTDHPTAPGDQLFENTVVSDIFKWVRAMARPVKLSFYRTRSGRETDLVIRTPGGYLGLDVCDRQDVRPKDARSLRALAKVLPRRWRGGVVVYRGETIRPVDEALRIWAVPAERLLA